MNDLNILEKIIQNAKAKGVAADAMITSTIKKSASCRMSKLENIETANRVNVNLRVIIGKRHASISTNQLSDAQELLNKVITMAEHAPENPYVSLPDRNDKFDAQLSSLSIFDPTSLSIEDLTNNAQEAEGVALSYSKIKNSEGAYSEHNKSNISFANTNDVFLSYQRSSFYNSVAVIAKENDSMEVGSDYSLVCNYKDLKDIKEIGKTAAERAIKKLNPRKVKTCKVPVVFDSQVSGCVLQGFIEAINGAVVSDGASFLRDKMQKKVFNESVNIVDDATLEGGIASYPFDDEGVLGRKLSIVRNGKLMNWLLDTQSARRLHLRSTGHANRSKMGNIRPMHSNLYMQPGVFSSEHIISQIQKGVYITDIFGFGSNAITGDYSHGASGFWIENGKISFPINEFTIASNMKSMFMNLLPANDLKFFRLINAPTIMIAEMTVAGK